MGVTEGSEPMNDAELRELLAAHALHASVPSEALQIERYLSGNPAAAAEFARLSTAAAWIAATEALTPPLQLRRSVLAAARTRQRSPGVSDDEVTRLFRAETDRFHALVPTLGPDDLGATTANGLSVRDLVIHLAAMETMVAAGLGAGVTTIDAGTDVEARTAEFVDAFALQPIQTVVDLWRDAIEGITRWARTGAPEGLLPWLGIDVRRDTLLISRSFETWIHANDIRRATGRALEHPRPEHLHRMADFSMRNLPAWLEVVGREHPGCTARVVLTGSGGGSWLVPLAPQAAANVEAVDVMLEVDIVDWCHRVGERVAPDVIAVQVTGDEALATDILEAASALATL